MIEKEIDPALKEVNKTHKPKPGLRTFLLAFPIILVGIYLLLKAIGAILIIADPLKTADAAVALSGDNGKRIAEAANLIQHKFADSLFLTYTDEQAVSEMLHLAEADGIPSRRIFATGSVVANTVDEARAIRQLALDRNMNSLVVITDPFHTFRTRLIFRRELRGSGISVQVRPVSGHWYRSGTWWQSAEGIQYTFQEYGKIFLFLFNVY